MFQSNSFVINSSIVCVVSRKSNIENRREIKIGEQIRRFLNIAMLSSINKLVKLLELFLKVHSIDAYVYLLLVCFPRVSGRDAYRGLLLL